MPNRTVAVSAVCVTALAGAAHAQVFLDRTAWVSAAGAVTTPDVGALGEFSFAEGTPTDLGGFFTVTATGGPDGAAELNDVPNFVFDFAPGGLSSVTFTFDTPITAFAAVWSNTFVQDGFSVSTGTNTYDLEAEAGDTLSSTFVGFVESSGFSTLTFTTNTPGGDDLVFFREFEYSVVPAPSAAAVLGFGGVLAARRRRG